ncbi:MAG: isoprenylcysteine carboxylmethyltransferase family protein [Candidatus Thorarchaeota archaeon]|nr:isoprenylcysteine carboxylmethyltransferase family protein [Candidatus Thorarchaeota archaeon]
MKIKGFDKVREKLPAYAGTRIAVLPLRGALAALLAYVFLVSISILPRMFSSITLLVVLEPFLPMLGALFIAALGLWLIWGVWNKRDQMKKKYGNLGYQKIIPRGVTGVFMVPPLVFLAFTSISALPPVPSTNPIVIQWSTSLLQLIGIAPVVDIWFRIVVAGVLIILGVLTVRSALETFGIDYMLVVYLYFPEESEIQEHEIYSVVRHPTYLGGVLLATAGLFFGLSVYSIFFGLLTYLVFRLQIWKEEKELVERFGEGYNEYRKKVPALLIRPSKIKAYFRFLRPD